MIRGKAMRPPFGLLRRVERRSTNYTATESEPGRIAQTRNVYLIQVTRLVLFWLVVWTHEADY